MDDRLRELAQAVLADLDDHELWGSDPAVEHAYALVQALLGDQDGEQR